MADVPYEDFTLSSILWCDCDELEHYVSAWRVDWDAEGNPVEDVCIGVGCKGCGTFEQLYPDE